MKYENAMNVLRIAVSVARSNAKTCAAYGTPAAAKAQEGLQVEYMAAIETLKVAETAVEPKVKA